MSANLDPILDTIDDSDRDSDSPVEEPPEPPARRRQPPKRTRIVDFDYSWVQWDRIPGFMADARLINRISAYWLYGVPIQLKEGGPNKYRYWYLCKDCHLNKDREILRKRREIDFSQRPAPPAGYELVEPS
ncbi:hypothetical protein EJ04DRAFT_553151 [Polyplosphaeria fusca]|uniref:Uncharacterized protein n=1 Tax=Polyplosphaeria fusca TaxID=682080 RepID=A0A9P4QZD9_9PLEO|nr:hypothetical protein EJ04DRAFT_553151 [Polyplosphaeria fusca]